MAASSFLVEIDDEPYACKSLQRLLRSVPMDAEAYSSCEKALHAVLRCESGCLVMNREAGIGRLYSKSTAVAPQREAEGRTTSWLLKASWEGKCDMLYTIAVILVILWLLGFISHIGGGLVHLLLAIAAIVVLFRIISGRRPVV
jgi:Family of unknown function (DUF5670)